MNRFKPYTIGLIASIFFHIPFFYLYLMIPEPINQIQLLLNPALVQCGIEDSKKETFNTSIKPPPLTLPPQI